MSKDYYEILGINRNSSQNEIKRTFKKLAFEYHPDRNPDNPKAIERFKQINEAYQVLSDENKRSQYDTFGRVPDEGFMDGGFSSGFGNLNDLFGSLFDEVFNGGVRTSSRRGRDLKYDLEISFEEAAYGTDKEIEVLKRVVCEDCSGSGAAPEGKQICNDCGGKGSIDYSKGLFAISQTCPRCRGTGKIITELCDTCNGEQVIRVKHKVKVKIPAGVPDNSRLRLRGEGEPGFGGARSGDLYVEISIKEHPFFKREGEDLYCEVPITVFQAIAGDTINIPTLVEETKLKIPAGTQPGQSFRIKGKGLPSLESSRFGDLFVIIQIEVPKNLNKKQKKLLKELELDLKEDQQPLISEYLTKIKDIFS